MCAAYFDDLITLESLNFRASARPFFLLVLSALGAPPTPAKSFPLGQHRAWLGAAVNLATLKDDLYFTLQPREPSVTQVIHGCHLAIARGSLTPADASTLRGQAGWTAALSAGRFGRIGMHFLKPGLVVLLLAFTRMRLILREFAPALSSEPWQLRAIALDPLQCRGVVRVGRLRFKPCGWPQQGWRSRLLDFETRLGITRIPRPSFRNLACLVARTIFPEFVGH